MAKHVVTMIPGEGTGPEICEAVRMVIDASGVDITWEYEDIGLDCLEQYGTLLPDKTIQSIAKNKVALKGPTTTPIGTGHKSANVTLRKVFDLYANVRPAKLIPVLKRPWDKIDIINFRENTEDSYAAIEHMVSDEVAQCLKVITWPGSYRIADFAFKWARANGRKKVQCVHKANIMKMTDGLFLEAFRQAAKNYPEIEIGDVIVDNCCMQLVKNPAQFDCLVLPNLYGDILTDLCAGLVGGLGFAPGANLGDNCAIFEAVHGSAPKYAGLKKVNPSAVLVSGIMMLRWLGETEAAERIERAMFAVLDERKHVTYDVGGTATTDEYAQAIVDKMGVMVCATGHGANEQGGMTMATATEAARATKKKQEIKLVGVDVYIITEDGIPQFELMGPFTCEFISNRGTKVWPGFVSPDLLQVNWYRCRFMATREVQDSDVNRFLDALSRKWWWSAAQKLWTYDGEPGYSKAY